LAEGIFESVLLGISQMAKEPTGELEEMEIRTEEEV
jgi:hypothetical protein